MEIKVHPRVAHILKFVSISKEDLINPFSRRCQKFGVTLGQMSPARTSEILCEIRASLAEGESGQVLTLVPNDYPDGF